MRFPKNPTKVLAPQSASAVKGYWYWLLKDGTLIGGTDDVNTGLWNHFETMCRLLGVDHRKQKVIVELHPLYKNGVMWTRYRALRVSVASTHGEVNVQVYGKPTSAQIEALRTLYYRNNQCVTWDLGIEYRKELSGVGSFEDFQTAFEKQFGSSSR
jgi:hypothetical protein